MKNLNKNLQGDFKHFVRSREEHKNYVSFETT